MLKLLIKEKKIKHLHIRVYKDPDSETYETIFSSSKWPYWRKIQRTTDELLVKETFQLWTNHAHMLKFLPARFGHFLIVGK